MFLHRSCTLMNFVETSTRPEENHLLSGRCSILGEADPPFLLIYFLVDLPQGVFHALHMERTQSHFKALVFMHKRVSTMSLVNSMDPGKKDLL